MKSGATACQMINMAMAMPKSVLISIVTHYSDTVGKGNFAYDVSSQTASVAVTNDSVTVI